MKQRTFILMVFVPVLLGAWALDAAASRDNPGSCLLFPYYEISDKSINVVTITNVNENKDVWVRIVFVDSEDCKPRDFFILLTPRDTFTFMAKSLSPFEGTGFIYAYTVEDKDPEKELGANYLVGQALVIANWDGYLANFSVNAVSFQSLKNPVQDGKIHLDGTEYSLAPKTLYFPRFFAQSSFFKSKIALTNLTGGAWFDVRTKWLVMNDNEVPFSLTFISDCFDLVDLTTVSNLFTESYLLGTNHDPSEPMGFANSAETGYFQITGDEASNPQYMVFIQDPSIYAILIETIGGLGFTLVDLPFLVEDGANFTNAMLWSVDPQGT